MPSTFPSSRYPPKPQGFHREGEPIIVKVSSIIADGLWPLLFYAYWPISLARVAALLSTWCHFSSIPMRHQWMRQDPGPACDSLPYTLKTLKSQIPNGQDPDPACESRHFRETTCIDPEAGIAFSRHLDRSAPNSEILNPETGNALFHHLDRSTSITTPKTQHPKRKF